MAGTQLGRQRDFGPYQSLELESEGEWLGWERGLLFIKRRLYDENFSVLFGSSFQDLTISLFLSVLHTYLQKHVNSVGV